jgi:hypothetical protein
MLQKSLLAFILITIAAAFGVNAVMAQSDEAFSVQKSTLTGAALPAGAMKMREASIPSEMRQTLSQLVAAGGDKIRQGDSEVLLWMGSAYKKAASPQLTKKLETAFQNSGWTYEIGEQKDDVIVFTLYRTAPERRALVGFFAMDNDAYVFAVTEMLRADAPVAESENQTEEPPTINSRNGSGGSANLVGKWWRGEGSGFIDYTGKTQYKSGQNYIFEFFPDGTVEYTYNKDVLSIVQCRTKEDSKARGKYTVSGNTLTMTLAAGNSTGSSSCEAKNNFKKTTPAEKITKTFTIKRMESLARPDNPWTLCFDGQEGDSCFEKSVK